MRGVAANELRVARVVLREQVKELILERILNGDYAPGERLVETRIAQELGTSQAPVREALRDLEMLRFVESEPFRGARVRAVSEEELAEIYPVRAAIEEVAAREAAVRLDGGLDALEELRSLAMHRATEAGDLHAQVAHDVNFHRLIIEACGNQHSARSLELTAGRGADDDHGAANRNRRPRSDRRDSQARPRSARGKDPERAGATLRRHVERFGALLKGETA